MEYQTNNYTIEVGAIVEDGENKLIYQIVNKDTNVVEYDDFILPRTIEALTNLQDKLDEADGVFNGGDASIVSLIKEGAIKH